jgi:ribosomal protein S18 acetylase RimI-like enzyme
MIGPSFSILKLPDLGVVSDLIMTSFYTGENTRSPWRQMFRLGELNRLQQNFPYDDVRHSMLVASCRSTHEIMAFVDIDARPAKRLQDPPRPYLSDLSVDPDWRRNGIASKLIQECEHLAIKMGKNELFIRVERNNTPALHMYEGLGYQAQPHDYFGVVDTTILLNKKLTVLNRNCTGDDMVLDFIL